MSTHLDDCNLIGSDDPPPYSIINEHGSGQVLLVGDHVSNTIPAGMDKLHYIPRL